MNQIWKSKPIPKDEAATEDEIREAYKALSEEESKKLYIYARFLTNLLTEKFRECYELDDLWHEALTRIFAEKRHWRKDDIDFVQLFKGTMRSIASHWRDKKLEGQLERVTENENTTDLINSIVIENISIDEVICCKQIIERIEKHFASDSIVLNIIVGFRNEYKGPDIQELFNLSKTQYETACKRLRRGVDKLKMKGEIDD